MKKKKKKKQKMKKNNYFSFYINYLFHNFFIVSLKLFNLNII